MAGKTTNYNLTKPSAEDFYDINVQNDNMDVIDEELKNLNDGLKASADNLTAHSNAANPHKITASTVGLGNVPNVATNDQTPTYTEASTLATLTSGEKMSVAFGKIKKAITSLISHIADTTKHITSTDRNKWDNGGGWQLLKTISIISSTDETSPYYSVYLSGFVPYDYDEIKFVLDGKFVGFTASNTTSQFRAYLSPEENGESNSIMLLNASEKGYTQADYDYSGPFVRYIKMGMMQITRTVDGSNVKETLYECAHETAAMPGFPFWLVLYCNSYDYNNLAYEGDILIYGRGKRS